MADGSQNRRLFMKRLILTACLVALAAPAAAQIGPGFDLPQTAATKAVAQAVTRGLCAQPAVDFLNALGQRAVVAMAPSWPADRHQIMWYGRSTGCDGKFQYFPAAAARGPHVSQGAGETT